MSWPLLLEDVASEASRASPPSLNLLGGVSAVAVEGRGGGGVELGLSDPLVPLPSDSDDDDDDDDDEGAVEGRMVTGLNLFLS